VSQAIRLTPQFITDLTLKPSTVVP
jgi:hypothetical protein